MNPVFENIEKRRSVRLYEDKPIPRELVQQIIDAGNLAPSGMNVQGWRFVVVQDKALQDKMVALSLPRYQQWLKSMPEAFQKRRAEVDTRVKDPVYYSAPVIIAVIGMGGISAMDCPMVCQNMMLMARSLGIGSCWVYIGSLALEDPEIKKAFELKEGEKIYGPIIFGYPKGDFPASPPKKPAVVKWM